MDIRNIQKTGRMYYVYLPTSWVKKHGISSSSKVSVEQNSTGSLTIAPELIEKKPKSIELSVNEENIQILQKLIMACYINPANSFKIRLKTEMDVARLLQQKKLLSIELVEMDKKAIICESNISLDAPELLLKTMVRKAKNLLMLMLKDYDRELIERYEEEIDRSKILIEKSVISGLTYSRITKLKMIELHYISLLAKSLERAIDHLIHIKAEDSEFLNSLIESFEAVREIVENIDSLDYVSGLELVRKVEKIKEIEPINADSSNKSRIKQYLADMSEVLLDWAITKEIN